MAIKRIIFGLGSNLGDRKNNINLAVENLVAQLELKNIKYSDFLENKALLKENAPKEWDIDFLNLAFSADIDLMKFAPEKILEIIKSIEKEIGRKTIEGLAWAPREIDIDILAIENLVINLGEKLTIPHKSLLERDFFVTTFAEIEPDWIYPVVGENKGKKIKEFL